MPTCRGRFRCIDRSRNLSALTEYYKIAALPYRWFPGVLAQEGYQANFVEM
jgi:hypothetical protein